MAYYPPQTYETHSIPAVYDLIIPGGALGNYNNQSRLGSGMVNLVPVKYSDGIVAETRYCRTLNAIGTGGSGMTVRGMYVWEKTIGTVYYFVVVHNNTGPSSKVYSSTDGVTFSVVNTLTNDGTTPVRFTEFIDATNTKKLVMVDGIEGYVFTSNIAGTKITDVDFPTPHVPFPVFIDGYLFLAKAATGDIYNSDLNDPALWTAGSFISSELYPDDVQATVKIQNYLVAVGTKGCEYFYDAANATASPLARIESAALPFGTPYPNTIAYNNDSMMFFANNSDGSVVLKFVEGTTQKEIKCPFINGFAAGASIGTYGMFFRHGSQLCYGLSFNCSVGGSISYNTPYFVYCFDTDLWTEFRDGSTLNQPFRTSFTASTTSLNALTYVAGMGTTGDRVCFGYMSAFETNASINGVGDDIDGTTFTQVYQEIRTSVQDVGNLNRKNLHGFGVSYLSSSQDAIDDWTNEFTISYDDTLTYSKFGNSQSSISSFNSFPFFLQLGNFRQRIFTFAAAGSLFFQYRFKNFQIKINQGSN